MLNYYFTTTQMKNFKKSFFPISRNFVNINNAKNFYQFGFLALAYPYFYTEKDYNLPLA